MANPIKFEPLKGRLKSLSALEKLADVTAENVDDAIDAWREKPPDRKFKGLLEAKEDG